MTVHPAASQHLLGQLSLNTELRAFLGDRRIRLLEAIALHGSISQAATAVPLSDALNHLWGQVSRIHEGPVAAEVTLILHGGRTLTAVITPEGLTRLDLFPGRTACTVFQASSVILATFL